MFNLALSSGAKPQPYIVVTTADRHLHLLELSTPTLNLVHSYSNSHDSPILDVVAIDSQHLMIGSMSGKILLYDLIASKPADIEKAHDKYVVRLAMWGNEDSALVASAGWDARVNLYRINTKDQSPKIGPPIATLTLPTNPEAILFITSPEHAVPILLVARRDSTRLQYYEVQYGRSAGFHLIGEQNLVPHSNAWSAFSPADIQVSPLDPFVVAIVS